MGSSFYNKNRMVLADYMNSYFSHKSTDCTIYSDDGYEFPIHKPWEPYVIQEVHVQQAPPYFVSALILVQRKDDLTKSKLVWTNVSKGGELWAEKLTT